MARCNPSPYPYGGTMTKRILTAILSLALAGNAMAGIDLSKASLKLAATTSSTLLRGNKLAETTTGVVVLPELRASYEITPGLAGYVSGALWGLQLLGGGDSAAAGGIQASSRSDLNGINNYVSAGLAIDMGTFLKIGAFTASDFVVGAGYGNLEQAPGTSKYDDGIMAYAGVSLTIYEFGKK